MSSKLLTKPITVIETAEIDEGELEKQLFLDQFVRELETRRVKLRPEVWRLQTKQT